MTVPSATLPGSHRFPTRKFHLSLRWSVHLMYDYLQNRMKALISRPAKQHGH